MSTPEYAAKKKEYEEYVRDLGTEYAKSGSKKSETAYAADDKKLQEMVRELDEHLAASGRKPAKGRPYKNYPEPPKRKAGAAAPKNGGFVDTGSTKNDFKSGDRVTSPITGKQYIVTGKPYRNGEIPVREINDDGTDNPDGTLRRIPARLLEPSTVKPKDDDGDNWVAKKNADIKKTIGELKLNATSETPEGQKLYVDVLENNKTLDKSDAYRRFTSLPADERKRVISDLLTAEDTFDKHENSYVHSAKHGIKPFRERFESGDRVQTKAEEEEQRREAETPKPGKFYRSKTGSLTLEVTEVDKDAGRVYGFPVDETGRRKTSRRMSGPLDKFASSWDVADDIKKGTGPETPKTTTPKKRTLKPSDLPGNTGTSTRGSTVGNGGGDIDPDNPDADLDAKVRSGRMTARQARAEKDRRNRERAATRAREGDLEDTGMTPGDFRAGDVVLGNDGKRYRVIGTPRTGSASNKVEISETDNAGNAIGTARRVDANTLKFEYGDNQRQSPADMSDEDLWAELRRLDESHRRENRAGRRREPSDRHKALRAEATRRDQEMESGAAEREAEADREGGRTDQVQAAGKYGPKVQRNNEMIEMFREAMGDEDRTEENRQGLYRQIQHMQRQNEMYVTASRLPEDAQKLYMYSQGPPDPKPEEKAVLDAYGKLVEMDALDSALVLLEETEKSGNGSAHIANTIGKVRAVVRDRETAAHGGVPRPDPSSREFSGTLRTPVEWRGFGSKPASRERMIADGTWTSAMQRGFVLGERYRAALAEWEKLAEKSNDMISETKEGTPMGDLQYKAVPIGGVEDDDGQGVVTAIVAVTGMRDNVNDIIQPGAFQKSLAKRTPKGVWHHNITDSVSRTEEIKELQPGDPQLPESLPNGQPWPGDAGALMVKTRFNLNTARGRDAYEDVKFFGTDQEWSIGYNVPTGGATIDRKTGVRKIQTLDLYEYSPVLFGAMPNARTQSVKSAQDTWAAIARLDSDDPYDMEIKSLFEETIAEEKAAPPWAKKKKKGGDDAEDSSESEKNEDDEESSDDDGDADDHGFSFEDEDEDDGDDADADTGKAGGGKFPFSKKPKAGKHAKKSFVFDSEAIDRVDRAVKSLADLRDYMVAEYKADAPPFPKKKFPAKKKKREGDPYEEEQGAEDEYENDDETDAPDDSDYETDPNEAGEMSQLVMDAGIDDAQDAAESFDQAMQAGDMDGVADAANLILDAVEAAPADLADDEALKAVVQAVAQALSSGDAEQPTEQKDPAEQQPAPTPAADKKKPPFPPKNEGKSMVIDPRAILDAIG